MSENMPPADRQRCSFIAVLGAPNAGKSTLVNDLVGSKVTIVSHKVQTTRVPVRGIAVEGDAQLVFIDTPGIFKPRRRLDRAMVEAAWSTLDADALVLLVDAVRGMDEDVERIVERLALASAPRVLVLNKVDRVADKPSLLALATKLTQKIAFDKVFMISALSGSGVADLKTYLATTAPLGPWHYFDDEISDAPERTLAAELTREKIYQYLHEELPYSITVETTAWKELRDGSVRIEQTVFVERDSQRKIVLGEKGRAVKQISSESRQELGRLLGRPAHLFLTVKVRENWGDDPERYREMGLDFPEE